MARSSIVRSLCLVVATLALVVGTTSTAYAQGGGGAGGGAGGAGGGRRPGGMMGGGMMGMDGNPISSQDIEKYVKIAKMTPDQAEAAKTLHAGYVQAMGEQRKKLQDLMEKTREEFRESRDPSVWQEMGEKMAPMRDEAKKLEKSFIDDVKSLLKDDQAAQWGRIEKSRRREQTGRMSFISGEAVDLFRVVDSLKLADEQLAPVNPVLERYESELDPVLVKRNEIQDQNMQAMRELMQQVMSGNSEDANKRLAEAREVSNRVRDINRKYAREVESLLPADAAPKFSEEFRKESFPRIYRQPRQAQTALDAALKLEDLDATQRKSLESIQETYKRDTMTLNKKAEEAMEASEQKMTVQGMMGGGMFGQQDPATEELRKQRRELETKTTDAIKQTLTEAQREKLPQPQNDRGAGGDRGPAGGAPAPAGGDGQQRRRPRGNNNGGGNGNGGGNN